MPAAKGRARNYAIPVPAWWLAAINKIREERTDAQILGDIATQTGRQYSRPVLSRYCAGTITTLELTDDLWRTYRGRYKLSRPFIIAETSDDASRIERAIADVTLAEVAALEEDLEPTRNPRQGRPIDSDHEPQGSKPTPGPRRGTAPQRRS